MPKDIMKAVKKTALDMKQKVMQNASSRIKFNKPLLFSALSAHNISRVEIDFDGSGDSGNMEEPVFFRGIGANQVQVAPSDIEHTRVEGALISSECTWDPKKKLWIHKTETPTISELVESICYDLLESNHGGWEINEGSFGKFVLAVKESQIALEYNERVESVEEHHETY